MRVTGISVGGFRRGQLGSRFRGLLVHQVKKVNGVGLSHSACAAVRGPHVFHPQPNLHEVFDDICVAADIASVEEEMKGGKVVKRRVVKTGQLGRKITAHCFRHTYATRLAQLTGGDQFVLKATLGHSQIHTTDRYCHVGVAAAEVVDMSKFLTHRPMSKGDVKNEKAASEETA